MAAKQKVGLRVAYSGDRFETRDLVIDGTGSTQQGKPVGFTDEEAAALIEHARDNGVQLMTIEPPGDTPAATTQE